MPRTIKPRLTVLAWVLIVVVAGCAPTIRYGLPPRLDRLETLKRGVSTEADVLLALGEPRGRGMARLSAKAPLNRIYVYELRQVQGRSAHQKLLLVFFEGERFDGYLWFSSKELLDVRQ
jgi:hypothetical protein